MLLSFVLVANIAAAPPLPPRTTAAQVAALTSRRAAATAASNTATPSVLAYFDSASFRAALEACCPVLNTLSAAKLLARFETETALTELVHNFSPGLSMHADVNLTVAKSMPYFPNLWQLQALGLVDPAGNPSKHGGGGGGGGGNDRQTNAEIGLFGLAPFVNASRPTVAEANGRLIYVALNSLKVDAGNPQFGTISVVFRSDTVGDLLEIAPVDTGMWESPCNTSSGAGHSSFGRALNCKAWSPWTVGTADALRHLILPTSDLHRNASTGAVFGDYTMDILIAIFARMEHAGWNGASTTPPLSANDIMSYWESDIVGNVIYDPARPVVKMIVASWSDHFATPVAETLREWCIERKWALAWSLGPMCAQNTTAMNNVVGYCSSHGHHGGGGGGGPVAPAANWSMHSRLLDGPVASALIASNIINATVSAADAALWAHATKDVAAARAAPIPLNVSMWKAYFDSAPVAQRLRFATAADVRMNVSLGSTCVGVDGEERLVCYL